MGISQAEVVSKINSLEENQRLFYIELVGKIEANFFENVKEEKEFRKTVNNFINETHEKEEAKIAKQILEKDDLEISSKLKFVLPFIIGKYELEFSTKKEKMPKNWKEFKALFIVED